MPELLIGDEFDRIVLAGVKLWLDETDANSISGTELSSIMNEVGYSQFDPVAAGMWLRKSRAFKRRRRYQGNHWKPTRKYKTLLQEYNLD